MKESKKVKNDVSCSLLNKYIKTTYAPSLSVGEWCFYNKKDPDTQFAT